MRKIIGVNLADSYLEASVIGHSFGMVKPLKVFRMDAPLQKEERNSFLAETFKAWKQEYAPDGIAVGLPLKYFLCQSLEMPVMKKRDMQKALAFELEKYLPLTVDEYCFDFFALPPEKTQQKVVVLAVKRDVIQPLAALVSASGLSLLSITCNTLAAFSGVQVVAGEKKMQGIFIHAREEGYEIAGLAGSQPAFLRYYPKGPAVQDEIADALSLYPGNVYYAGRADRLTEGGNSRKFEISVAHALATAAVRKVPFMLDFLPQEYAVPRKDYYPVLLGGLAAAAVAFFLLGGVVRYYKEFSTLRSIESRIAAIKEKTSPLIEAQKKFDALQSDRRVLLDFRQKSGVAVQVLADLSTLLPPDAWLVNFSVDDRGKVEIEGFAKKASRLIIDLENSAAFKNAAFSSPVMSKDGEDRFTIRMEVEGI